MQMLLDFPPHWESRERETWERAARLSHLHGHESEFARAARSVSSASSASTASQAVCHLASSNPVLQKKVGGELMLTPHPVSSSPSSGMVAHRSGGADMALHPVRHADLHPLLEPGVLEEFAQTSEGLPTTWRMAFAAANHLRRAAGFDGLHVYSREWSERGQAHAEYYVATGHFGHFEVAASDWYTAGGNAAAGCSGLAYDGRNPLDVFWALLEGPFHRRQFLHCAATSMGVAYHSGGSEHRVCGLFPCEPHRDAKWSWPERFLLWPPRSYLLAPGAFHGESPDPRPDEFRDRQVTGLIASIAFTQEEDVVAFAALEEVRFTDLCTGEPIAFWTRDPSHPPQVSAEEWLRLYGTEKPPSGNHLECLREIWVGAVEPLMPGHDYALHVSFQLAGEIDKTVVSWGFGVAPALDHKIGMDGACSDSQAQEEFQLSVSICGRGDAISLGPGTFMLPAHWWYGQPRLIEGRGPSHTSIVYGSQEAVGRAVVRTDLTLCSLRLVNDEHESFLWVVQPASVVLKAVQLAARGPVRRFHVMQGAALSMLGCDLRQYGGEDRCIAYVQRGGHALFEQCRERKVEDLWVFSDGSMWPIKPSIGGSLRRAARAVGQLWSRL
ncbi:unnamed protein product [Prorocentrum cordatum]|uniref:SCP domain-containing protein n=1 Tax=Prorocentrum cordatum TaxID=2364126 RepID=A0ABN9Q3F9_9DINO|nr:unnamed protein product [Polarella glacialis]